MKFQNFGNFLFNEEDGEQNVNFVKKNLTLLHHNFLNRLTFKLSIAYLVFVLVTAGASLTFHLSLNTSVNGINQAISSGISAIDDFASGQVLTLLVKEYYFNATNY
jgi:hypothetical protein